MGGAISLALTLPRCSGTNDASGGDCALQPIHDVPLPKRVDWVSGARVGGLSTWGDATPCDYRPALDQLAAQGCTVVEVDADLSSYLSDDLFQQNLDTLNDIAAECHKRGMRAVAYYPTLEVLSDNADRASTKTMSRDHPDWVQVFLNGSANTFIGTGGGGLVFWVDKGVESAWMCPLSGYREYYLSRIERLASTALDGYWGDVPLLSDIASNGTWPCTNPACRQGFAADNPGFQLPAHIDDQSWPNFSDPTFRRWVLWRHKLISDFQLAIAARAHAVNPNFAVIFETVTMDYNGRPSRGSMGPGQTTDPSTAFGRSTSSAIRPPCAALARTTGSAWCS